MILLRPVIDNFYFLKEVSPLLSPLYIVGVLTPLLCLIAIFRYRKIGYGAIDKVVLFWSLSILLTCILLFLYQPFSLLSIEFILKLALPVYLYYFARRLVTSRKDLHGLLQSFLYSCILVAAILLYEVFVNPIREETSRGLSRIQGNFGDVVSYGIYIVFAFIISTYFFFSNQHLREVKQRLVPVFVVAALCLLGVLNIHHTATYFVFAALLLLFVTYNFRSDNRLIALLLVVGCGLFLAFFGREVLQQSIEPLLAKDIQVFEGVEESGKLLHGRVGRWQRMLDLFFEQSPVVQLFGYPLNFEYAYHFIGIGAHNDLVRMLFAGGFVGLGLYLLVLFQLAQKSDRFGLAQKYLISLMLVALLLYSVSITPTFYAPFLYLFIPVLAYAALPEKNRLDYA